MKENKYDEIDFFEKYSQMTRSQKGLEGAGEWHELKKLLPDFKGKSVLDLGCGYGWHCKYAADNGAERVIGVDISEKMLETAKIKNNAPQIEYMKKPIEEIGAMGFGEESFDVVLSSLAFHYIKDFTSVCKQIFSLLKSSGKFIFSCEHPVFTAEGKQDFYYDENGEILHFPVDNYFIEGKREAVFLGESVTKYHRTLTSYVSSLISTGFKLTNIVEPMPEEHMIADMPDEMRRPMMLIIAAEKSI